MLRITIVLMVLIFSLQSCSSKKVEKIDYKIQQKNSEKALKEL